MNSNGKVYPSIRKSISDFLKDDEGTTLRTKAAIVGPTAVAALVLMSKELIPTASAKSRCHASHRSHVSSTKNNTNTVNHATHTSHSSNSNSGFGHSADTYQLETRNKE